MKPYFNLTEEKWVRVLDRQGQVYETTLPEALLRAHELRDLAGETPTQDVAMLRFLLAVLYAALFGGEPFPSPDDALEAWFDLWQRGRFPEDAVTDYLRRWRERFWLFHERFPFGQVASGRDGLNMENAADRAKLEKPGKPSTPGVQRASKLNGAIMESGNTEKFFNSATGEGKNSLSCPEAARWLIHVIGYDDGGIKYYYPKNSAMNRTDDVAKCTVAWLGTLSSVYARGDTLFETLMLNLVLLRNGEMTDEAIWPRQRPSWEYDEPHVVEAQGIPLPDNPAELCSLLSRRILLIRREDRVLGFIRYVGEAFPREAALTEQWTLWTVPKAKKDQVALPVPRPGRLPAQMWREMGAILVGKGGEGFAPGVVRWVGLLAGLNDSPLKDAVCSFRYVKAMYEVSQSSNMTEALEDSVTFSAGLLTDLGAAWLKLLQDELDLCGRIAWQVGLLAEHLFSAEGGKVYEGKGKRTPTAQAERDVAQEQFFYELDRPFRHWLNSLRAEDDSVTRQVRLQQLHRVERRTALRCGRERMDRISPTAYGARMKGEGEERHYTAAQAWVIFRAGINKLIPPQSDEQETRGGAEA